MIDPQANLDGIPFGMATSGIDTVERIMKAKWPGVDRVQNTPKKQFTGLEDEPITIQGNYFPDVHGKAITEQLRAICGRGKPVTFTMGGSNLGMWCITEVRAMGHAIMAGGKSRRIDFTVTLEKFT